MPEFCSNASVSRKVTDYLNSDARLFRTEDVSALKVALQQHRLLKD